MQIARSETADLDNVLRQSRAIDRLAQTDRDRLIGVMRRVTYPAGTYVFTQGTAGNFMAVVVDGVLRVQFHSDGVDTDFSTVRRGEFVGEMAVLDPAPRSASILAETDAVVYQLDALDLEVLAEACPAASVALIDAVCFNLTQRLRKLTRQLDRLATMDQGRHTGQRRTTRQPTAPDAAPKLPPRRKSRPISKMWKKLTMLGTGVRRR